jgi:tetratricopeptide (TPR) repeat protein
MGDRTYQASEASLVAEALEAQGRIDEAEEWIERSLQDRDPDPDDLVVRARILARRGQLGEAEAVIRSALELQPQSLISYGTDAHLALAEVLARDGRPDEARIAGEDALRRFEAKGVIPLVSRARALLESLPA